MILKNCENCSKEFRTFPSYIKVGRGRFCSMSCKAIASDFGKVNVGKSPWNKGMKGYLAGDKHYNWNGGKSSSRDFRIICNDEYKNWRQSIFKRDGWKCQMSDVDCKGQLEAHHILRWSEFPKLRYEIKNGITLCHFHHPRKKKDESRLSPYFQQKVNQLN